jgi:hypothetical protein
VAEIRATRSAPGAAGAASVAQFIGDSEAAQSITVTGTEFEVTAKPQFNADATATILIIGNETGGRALITLTSKQVTISTTVVDERI